MSHSQSGNAKLGVGFLWAALIVGALEILLSWVLNPFNFLVVAVQVLSFLIWWWLTAKVAAGHTWARIWYLVGVILGAPFLATLTALFVQLPGLAPVNGLAALALLWLPSILEVLGLIVLFSATSSSTRVGLVFLGSVAVVAAATALMVPAIMSELLSDPKSLFSLLKVANKVKQEQRLPAMIDDDTEAFDVKARTGMLTYYYRLVKVNANGFDSREFLDRMKPSVAEQFCRPENNDLFKAGVVLRAAYVDSSKAPIGSLDVRPGDCETITKNEPVHHEVWKKYVPQPEARADTQADTTGRTSTTEAAPTATPAKRVYQPVETPEMKAQALVDDANQQMRQGNYEAAIKDFKAALALQPDNYAARSGLQEAQRVR